MASWMIHLRIADGIMDSIEDLDLDKFVAGNVAPDSGRLCDDRKTYVPPKHITHWQNPRNRNESLKEKLFMNYIKDKKMNGKTSFYLGYYIHLDTDILWKELIFRPARDQFLSEFKEEVEFVLKIKEDWYDTDRLFLKENPEFRAYKLLENIKSFPNVYFDYYDYYDYHAFENKIREISHFYNDFEGNLNREYPYFDQFKADTFVEKALKEIRNDLTKKNIL